MSNIGERPSALASLWGRAHGKYQRYTATRLFMNRFSIDSAEPVVSFTFDDFPTSALRAGGAILEQFGVRGTYYASFGLVGTTGPTGRIFAIADVKPLLERGHEIGCHTFNHCHSWDTSRKLYEDSIVANQAALDRIAPGVRLRTFSYPI